MTDRHKRPRDAKQLAKFIVDVATGCDEPKVVKEPQKSETKAKGGRARARSLNPEERSTIASLAASAGWKKRDDQAASSSGWLKYYNEDRPHGAIGYKAPIELPNPGSRTGQLPR
jgi:transposase InsO family protein